MVRMVAPLRELSTWMQPRVVPSGAVVPAAGACNVLTSSKFFVVVAPGVTSTVAVALR